MLTNEESDPQDAFRASEPEAAGVDSSPRYGPLDVESQAGDEIVLAEFAARARPPRLWSPLVVSLGGILVALCVSTFALVAAALLTAGPQAFTNVGGFQAWLESFGRSRTGLLVLILPGQLVFFTAAVGAALLSSEPFAERLGLLRGRLPLWTWGVFVAATPVVGMLTSLAMSLFLDDMGENLRMMEEMFRHHKAQFLLGVIFLVSVVPGVVEEVLFRGYVQCRLLKRLPAGVAVGMSALLFAVAHLDPIHVLAVLPLGVWLGVVAWQAKSTWPAILCHMANNLIAIIGTGEELDSITPVTVGILAVCGAAFLLAIVIMIACRKKA